MGTSGSHPRTSRRSGKERSYALAPTAAQFPSAPTIILFADLAGYARGFLSHPDSEMAAFTHRYYRMAGEVIEEQGGRIIKFLGDGVLSIFPPAAASETVSAAITMQRAIADLALEIGLEVRLGANIHFGEAVATEFGTGSSRRYDVIGRTVNQTFLLGRGGGIRLSERMYRKLPSSERSPWDKRKLPAVYVLEEAGEPYFTASGKGPAQNAARW